MAWSTSVDTVLANKGKNNTKSYVFTKHTSTQFANTAARFSRRFVVQLTRASNRSSAAAKGVGAAVISQPQTFS